MNLPFISLLDFEVMAACCVDEWWPDYFEPSYTCTDGQCGHGLWGP